MIAIDPPATGPCVIQRVMLCDLYQRNKVGHKAEVTSLPGHLIQLMCAGRTTHEIEGRRYILEPGHLVWYHEDEMVRIKVHRAPWRYYTLNFIAPALSPPLFEHRVRRVGRSVERQFEKLLTVWRHTSVSPAVREMRVQSRLLELLASLWRGQGQPFAMDPRAALWWQIETQLRQDLSQPISLSVMVEQSGKSQVTIARACQSAVSVAPMKRVKQIRMSYARGLVRYSSLRISEVANRIGYTRVHEFSRDYKKYFGHSPTQEQRILQADG